jgi:hypothetical protein
VHLCVVRCIIQVRVVKKYVVTYPENPTGALTAFFTVAGARQTLGAWIEKANQNNPACTSTCSRTEPRHGSTEGIHVDRSTDGSGGSACRRVPRRVWCARDPLGSSRATRARDLLGCGRRRPGLAPAPASGPAAPCPPSGRPPS